MNTTWHQEVLFTLFASTEEGGRGISRVTVLVVNHRACPSGTLIVFFFVLSSSPYTSMPASFPPHALTFACVQMWGRFCAVN